MKEKTVRTDFEEIYPKVREETKGFPQWVDFMHEVERERTIENLKTQLQRYGFDWRVTEDLYEKLFQ